MKKLLMLLAEMLLTALLALLVCVLFIEWMAGCGETYMDAKGNVHAYECVFINK